MKKIYLFMLMAVGLLISGNAFGVASIVGPISQPSPYAYGKTANKATIHKAALATSEEQQVFLTVLGKETMYTSFSAALAALPDNSTPATIKLGTDVTVSYNQSVYTIASYKNITIDLNNHVIYAGTDVKKGSEVFNNSGTLIIEDNSPEKGGKITSSASNPDLSEVPGYGSYTIINNGTLILNSGTIENTSSGGACYAVENRGNGHLIINGGTITTTSSNAIRMNLSGNTDNKITMNGGEITSEYYCVEIQHQSTGTHKAEFVMNDGTLRPGDSFAFVSALYSGKADFDNTSLIFNGGDIYGYIYFSNNPYGKPASDMSGWEKIEINGGVFHENSSFLRKNAVNQHTYTEFIKGGTFCDFNTGLIKIGNMYDTKSNFPTEEDFLNACKSLNFFVTDYHNYISSYTEGVYWAIATYNDDGSIYNWQYLTQSDYPGYTAEQLTEWINNNLVIQTYPGYSNYWLAYFKSPITSPYDAFQENDKNYIADGFKAIPISGVDGTNGNDLIITTLDKKDVIVGEGEKKLDEIVSDIKPDGTTEITIVPNTTEGQTTIINITENTTVNKIEVTNKDEEGNKKGEAQIVVGTGVVLNVGNGGIVSENDILTTVLVKDGGTLIIGKNGVEQDGEATPIEIKSSEENGSGVLIFNPNAKHEDTKNYAEVDLYTYCKKVNDKYTWQQFAIPVTGLTNDKVVKTPNKTSYVFEWDYATYGWSQLNNWAQLDEPFAGYDITNVSENGGVVYTFKGDLIGNQNIQLTLPHKDYCVMGNSYTAPIDITALFDQINKEMSENTIEKTVYKYDAKAGYYVYTNELEQTLSKLGITNASFTDIKPMEGFLLNLQNGNTAGVMLNYANAVYTPATTPKPASAPRMANTDMVLAKINVKSAHAMDQMTLVESDEFSAEIENGKDAFKYLNEGANLYAFDGTNKLAMVATDNLEGTMLAFQAAEDEEYTLTFDRALNADYSLLDLLTGESIEMVEGNTYTFYATPNTLNPSRFMVVATAKAPTDMVNTKANKAATGVYTIMGQYLGNGEMWNELPQGVYMVNGVKVIK